MVRDDQLRGVPLLVLANKQDLPHALSASDIADKLGLESLKNRQWHIEPTCAMNGDGIHEGLDWMVQRFSDSVKK